MSVRNKIGVSFAVILLMFIASSLYSNHYIKRITAETELFNRADKMLENALQIRRYEKDFVLRGEKQYISLVKSYVSKISSEARGYERKAYVKVNTKDIKDLLIGLEAYRKSFDKYVNTYEEQPSRSEADAVVFFGRRVMSLSEKIRDNASSCITCYLGRIRKSQVIVLIAFILTACIMFWAISRTVVRPIKEFQMLSNKIMEEGMLDSGHIALVDKILENINTNDEIGELARAYRGMVVKCHNSYLGLHNKVKEVEGLYKVKSEFTSIVSHELRTPLTAIKEGIELVLDGSVGETNSEQKEFLGIAKRNVDRLARLINYVLDFSKLTSRKFKFKKEMVNVNSIIDSVVNTYKLVIEKKKLFINTRIDETKELAIELDADRINQVLTNLIDNATKFTDEGGITVSTSIDESGNLVKICVEDTGVGIEENDIPKLFQPFSQLGGIQGRKVGGTGLGLAICKEIIKQLGGKIWVESKPGRGSRFCFILSVKERREHS